MAGGDARAHVAAAGFFGKDLEKARVRIIGFVAVHVHQAAGTFGQVHEKFHRAHALVAGVFKVRDTTDHVGAQANGFLHQLAAIAVGLDALLRKRHDLKVDQVRAFFADFQHGFQRGQVWVGDVDMGADMLDAVSGQGLNSLLGAGLGVFLGDGGLALAPALNALEQCSTHIPARFAGSKGGIKVDMRLDEGRYHQVTGGVQIARP